MTVKHGPFKKFIYNPYGISSKYQKIFPKQRFFLFDECFEPFSAAVNCIINNGFIEAPCMNLINSYHYCMEEKKGKKGTATSLNFHLNKLMRKTYKK